MAPAPASGPLAISGTAIGAVPALAPEPPLERISFSLELLASARSIVMLVSGAEKAETVRRVIEDRDPSLPAAYLPSESVCWILDRPAVERL